jgi:hypothetical protein
MVVQTWWGAHSDWVEMSATKDEARRRARTLRHTPGVGKVRVFERNVRAGGVKAQVFVIVCWKGAGDVE